MLITRFCCNTIAAVTRKEGSIVIDPDGDLEIAVSVGTPSKTPPVLYRVSSSALRLASPKWKTLLSDTAPTATVTAKEPRLLFEEDAENIPTLTKVLNIAHHKHIPGKACLDYDVLVKEVSFCIRHETTELMRPWLESSVQAWLPKATRPGFEDWLIIAYGLKYQSIFEHLSCPVAAAVMREDPEGAWVLKRESADPGNSTLILDHFPPAIRGKILAVQYVRLLASDLDFSDNVLSRRQRVLESLLQTCYDCIDDLSSQQPKLYVCPDKRWTPTCASMTLGSLIRGFRNMGIWPQRPSAKDLNTSVNDLRASILGIEMSTHHAGPYYDVELPEASTDCPVASNFRAAIMTAEIEYRIPVLTPACSQYFQRDKIPAPPQLWMPAAEADHGFHGADFLDVEMSDSEDSSYSGGVDPVYDSSSEDEDMRDEEEEDEVVEEVQVPNPEVNTDSDCIVPMWDGTKKVAEFQQNDDDGIEDEDTYIE